MTVEALHWKISRLLAALKRTVNRPQLSTGDLYRRSSFGEGQPSNC